MHPSRTGRQAVLAAGDLCRQGGYEHLVEVTTTGHPWMMPRGASCAGTIATRSLPAGPGDEFQADVRSEAICRFPDSPRSRPWIAYGLDRSDLAGRRSLARPPRSPRRPPPLARYCGLGRAHALRWLRRRARFEALAPALLDPGRTPTPNVVVFQTKGDATK